MTSVACSPGPSVRCFGRKGIAVDSGVGVPAGRHHAAWTAGLGFGNGSFSAQGRSRPVQAAVVIAAEQGSGCPGRWCGDHGFTWWMCRWWVRSSRAPGIRTSRWAIIRVNALPMGSAACAPPQHRTHLRTCAVARLVVAHRPRQAPHRNSSCWSSVSAGATVEMGVTVAGHQIRRLVDEDLSTGRHLRDVDRVEPCQPSPPGPVRCSTARCATGLGAAGGLSPPGLPASTVSSTSVAVPSAQLPITPSFCLLVSGLGRNRGGQDHQRFGCARTRRARGQRARERRRPG